MNPNILNDLKDFLVDWHAFKPVYPQRFSIFDILKERNVSYNMYLILYTIIYNYFLVYK